ncbi:hypothetical protein EXN57_14185 [Clostridium botulinum]|nr:hypothetical protein [Clostridium botulinum]NFD33956.1 hypothetical protein [Clostridium botulinum]NFD59062.1 hypothetical protein [Clostridium botulinum]NFE02413.1 hypothetical protein [Clostridium botulinum]
MSSSISNVKEYYGESIFLIVAPIGILIDYFGWFAISDNPVSITRTLRVVVMIFAILLA